MNSLFAVKLAAAGARLASIALLLTVAVAPVVAQPPGPPPFEGPGGPGGGRFGRGPGGPGMGMGMLLRSDEVRAELELMDDQVQELRSIEDEMRGRMREMFGGRGGERGPGRGEGRRGGPPGPPREGGRGFGPPPGGPEGGPGGRWEEMRGRMDEARREMEGRVAEILTPEQMDRLKQIELQARLKMEGPRAMMSPEVVEAIGLSPDEADALRDRAEQLRGEMEEKMAAVRKEMQDKLLEGLTSEQRAKFEAMTGESFDVPMPDWRGGRGGRGGGFRGRPRDGATPPPPPAPPAKEEGEGAGDYEVE
jgi:Spy/CpxP family protein refolding chaperone